MASEFESVFLPLLKAESESVKRILIVEDDMVYAQLLSRFARQCFRSVVVDICHRAGDAYEQCLTRHFDILLVDHTLPDFSGSELLHKLQSVTDRLSAPAIILTADGGSLAAAEALRANAYDFLPKRLVTKDSLNRSISNAIAKHSLQQSVVERTIALEQANVSLKKSSLEIRNFYQTVSHEVKTPLAANREFVSLVRDGVLGSVNDQQIEVLDHALASCDQISGHFNDLVEMTRLDAGKIRLSKHPVVLDSLLKRTMASCARSIDEKDLNVTLPSRGLDVELCVDGDRITQVLANLLSNAVKYTPNGGAVELSIESDSHTIKICVSDTGCGIDAQYTDCVFNRLFQIGDSSDQHSGAGLGLGLSIAREIVELHDGEVWVESVVDVGSKFYVQLPVSEE